MKIVIQCAGWKNENAGRLAKLSGEKVLFVAHPEKCIQQANCYRPDDNIDGADSTWRDYLKLYNQKGLNPDNLCYAWKLYRPPIYKALVEKYGAQNVFVLSAGWGLIRSDFLTPYYDITFSNQGKPYSKRRPSDWFKDFNQLQDSDIHADETIYFFGGQEYLPLYRSLTQNIVARKVVYHSQGGTYQPQGYESIPYRSYTNWHYSCAQDFIDGRVSK